MIDLAIRVRSATLQDRPALSDLLFHSSQAHRHLDWCLPLDWLGSSHFWVLEKADRLLAALACPPQAFQVAWVRLFAVGKAISAMDAWRALWNVARAELAHANVIDVGILALHDWLHELLPYTEFSYQQDIVMLEWRGQPVLLPPLPPGISLRPMHRNDLPAVLEVDRDAFAPLWQLPAEELTIAFEQAIFATVLEADSRLLGYQLSTAKPAGAHLARLAVRQETQGRGLGSLLVAHLIMEARRRGLSSLSVNTQATNRSSLAVYHKMGFIRTGERYPIYSARIG